jgi:tRNA dimethylallyltransferase
MTPLHDKRPVACIVGPTASGKTAAALHLAQQAQTRGQRVELISMDSALVYRGMDIGTAKPSAEERAACAHHLLDILDPAQAYSAAQFVADARRLIDDIRRRGAQPLIVGGTMLYLKALQSGLSALPQADAQLRAQLDADAARLGWPALHARLAAVDAPTAARLAPNDAQRIQRALEVWLLSGRPLSAHFAPPAHPEQALPLRILSLEPSDRSVLHARIADRFDAMLAAGFLDEVRALRQRGDLSPALPSIRAVGYRQAWNHLDGMTSSAEFREQAISATRQLAKRQLTWLRSLPQREVFDCLAPLSDTLARIEKF